MTEEPRIQEAHQRLKEMLDSAVPKELIRMAGRQLDADAVEQAEEALQSPDDAALESHVEEAREQLMASLLKYLEAMADKMHFQG